MQKYSYDAISAASDVIVAVEGVTLCPMRRSSRVCVHLFCRGSVKTKVREFTGLKQRHPGKRFRVARYLLDWSLGNLT